ncbi:potassium/sodium hyperpolarization-activated cyclic nucleotide-gated channel 1-like [Anoplophora glabripennis]|uniref:potassium/sodium hyperpolarization-activated cyclic nucleotide-gated channel 1-like n=1 Tax=Anoplophora glabripennis TaxID=217634 RepID=UPI0008752991|nr:potassium/sodium hyperpolarization-activated cyclic nucleotide-gated channel 1-like [Anoplophora glabripennis]
MPRFEDHECTLARQEEDVVKQFIDTGVFITVRRTIRSLCMVSRSHPETPKYFKSYSACRNEEIRHLVHNYNMIHPFSKLNLFWEFYMFFVFSLQFLLIPIDASMIMYQKVTVDWARFVVDMMQITDVIKLFFTGFYHEEKSKVILDCNAVAKRYLTGHFFFDIISSLHFFLFPLRIMNILVINDTEIIKIPLRLFNRLKIARMSRWLYILDLFRQYMGYSSYLFKGIKVVLIFFVVTFWAFSINFFVEYFVEVFLSGDETINLGNRIFRSYYEATLMLLLVGYGKHDIKEWPEYLNAIFFLCFGFGLQLTFLVTRSRLEYNFSAQILQVWTKYASAENKHHSLHKQFKEYMKYKELPVSLRERIFSYFQFKFHKQFFKESDINNMVSPLLKQEILLHVTRNHIERVDFFKYLPENILMKVVAQLKSEIYLPGDVIISAGTTGTSMFFIYHGTVAVYTPSGKEICHLEDGAHFGEIALILSETRVATVIAVTASELFMLKRSDFLAAIEPFPEFRDQLITVATERLRKTILQTESEL